MSQNKGTSRKALIGVSIAVLAASAVVTFWDPFQGAQLVAGLVGAAALITVAVLSIGGRGSTET